MSYAHGTAVSAEKSLTEIRKLVTTHGGTNWKYGEDDQRIIVGFTTKGFDIRIEQLLPVLGDRALTHNGRGTRRTPTQHAVAYEAERRRRWRVLLLRLKVRLEMIAEGVETIEQAFTAYLVGPDNTTVEESLLPRLREARSLPVPKELTK